METNQIEWTLFNPMTGHSALKTAVITRYWPHLTLSPNFLVPKEFGNGHVRRDTRN